MSTTHQRSGFPEELLFRSQQEARARVRGVHQYLYLARPRLHHHLERGQAIVTRRQRTPTHCRGNRLQTTPTPNKGPRIDQAPRRLAKKEPDKPSRVYCTSTAKDMPRTCPRSAPKSQLKEGETRFNLLQTIQTPSHTKHQNTNAHISTFPTSPASPSPPQQLPSPTPVSPPPPPQP